MHEQRRVDMRFLYLQLLPNVLSKRPLQHLHQSFDFCQGGKLTWKASLSFAVDPLSAFLFHMTEARTWLMEGWVELLTPGKKWTRLYAKLQRAHLKFYADPAGQAAASVRFSTKSVITHAEKGDSFHILVQNGDKLNIFRVSTKADRKRWTQALESAKKSTVSRIGALVDNARTETKALLVSETSEEIHTIWKSRPSDKVRSITTPRDLPVESWTDIDAPRREKIQSSGSLSDWPFREGPLEVRESAKADYDLSSQSSSFGGLVLQGLSTLLEKFVSWNARIYRLDLGVLFVYDTEDALKPISRIDLAGATLQSMPDREFDALAFQINLLKTTDPVILRAGTEEENMLWQTDCGLGPPGGRLVQPLLHSSIPSVHNDLEDEFELKINAIVSQFKKELEVLSENCAESNQCVLDLTTKLEVAQLAAAKAEGERFSLSDRLEHLLNSQTHLRAEVQQLKAFLEAALQKEKAARSQLDAEIEKYEGEIASLGAKMEERLAEEYRLKRQLDAFELEKKNAEKNAKDIADALRKNRVQRKESEKRQGILSVPSIDHTSTPTATLVQFDHPPEVKSRLGELDSLIEAKACELAVLEKRLESEKLRYEREIAIAAERAQSARENLATLEAAALGMHQQVFNVISETPSPPQAERVPSIGPIVLPSSTLDVTLETDPSFVGNLGVLYVETPRFSGSSNQKESVSRVREQYLGGVGRPFSNDN